MISRTYFDDTLPAFVSLVYANWGPSAIANNIFLRDAAGKLTLIVLELSRSLEERLTLSAEASKILGVYVDEEGFAVSTPDELFDERLKNIQAASPVPIECEGFSGIVNVVDRRIVGSDWLRKPVPTAKPPVRIVFGSIKGGVGRSTALCVLAEHLSSRGKRVLAVDMDIEAPGLGNMLLPVDILPEFGLLDYLVEQGLGPLNEQFFVDMVGSSWLGGGRGRVDVLPAIGRRSFENPSNVLAKIARAYLPGAIHSDGEMIGESTSFMDHIASLIEKFADPLRYDAILIDARAGLHETTASAIVGLGANVLFFGVDQPQTIAGYELLLSHLGTLPFDVNDDWRERLTFVQAKAPANKALRSVFAAKMESTAKKYLKLEVESEETELDVTDLKDTFDIEWAESESPIPDSITSPMVISILDNDRYHQFDPLSDRDVLDSEIYAESFGEILHHVSRFFEQELEQEIKYDDD
jgi:MinD-like ATPase involved in chromosome partitioning or flagellar assembly